VYEGLQVNRTLCYTDSSSDESLFSNNMYLALSLK